MNAQKNIIPFPTNPFVDPQSGKRFARLTLTIKMTDLQSKQALERNFRIPRTEACLKYFENLFYDQLKLSDRDRSEIENAKLRSANALGRRVFRRELCIKETGATAIELVCVSTSESLAIEFDAAVKKEKRRILNFIFGKPRL